MDRSQNPFVRAEQKKKKKREEEEGGSLSSHAVYKKKKNSTGEPMMRYKKQGNCCKQIHFLDMLHKQRNQHVRQ